PEGLCGEEPANLARQFQNVQTAMSRDNDCWNQLRHSLSLLQARLDQQTEEFCAEAAGLKAKGEQTLLRRQAGLFMQSQLEQLETELQRYQFVRALVPEKVVARR